MKFYTSYYANYRNIPKTMMCVGISRVCPEWFANNKLQNFMFVKNNFLAPSEELLANMKAGNITEEDYKREYITGVLSKVVTEGGCVDFPTWIKKAEEVFSSMADHWEALVFMCYESPNEFCHRHLLRRLMKNVYNIDCEEYGYKDAQVWPDCKVPQSTNKSVNLF